MSCEGIDYGTISRTNLSAIQNSSGKEGKLRLTCQFKTGTCNLGCNYSDVGYVIRVMAQQEAHDCIFWNAVDKIIVIHHKASSKREVKPTFINNHVVLFSYLVRDGNAINV
jgi:hypothetical protein